MNAVQALERAAFAAHRRGESWAAFWQQHGDAIRAVEPYNVAAFHRLCGRLLALLVSGDDCGCHSLDGLPDAYDVLPTPDDVGTQARLDWAAIGTPPRVWVLPRRCDESIPLPIPVFLHTESLKSNFLPSAQ